MLTTKRLVLISLFIAQATALNILERFIVIPMAFPGVKLGLANIFTVLAILLLGWKETFVIVAARCSLAALFGGNPLSFLFSISGGLLSALIMILLWQKFKNYISITILSLVGAVAHNIGQLFVAAIVIQDFRIYFYLPVLLASSLITGYLVGLISKHTYLALSKTKRFGKQGDGSPAP